MNITPEQETIFRAVAAACNMPLGDADCALTRDTISDFEQAQGTARNLDKGFYYWKETRSPKGKLLVQDTGDFRITYFSKS